MARIMENCVIIVNRVLWFLLNKAVTQYSYYKQIHYFIYALTLNTYMCYNVIGSLTGFLGMENETEKAC
jgi:hypothetical protein